MKPSETVFDIDLKSLDAKKYIAGNDTFFERAKNWVSKNHKFLSYKDAAEQILNKSLFDYNDISTQEQITSELQRNFPGEFGFTEENGEKVILQYNQNIPIDAEDEDFFGFFFFFWLANKPTSQIYPFLDYHLNQAFHNDLLKFISFLEDGLLIFGAETKLHEDRKRLIDRWIKKNNLNGRLNGVTDNLADKGKTTARQVLVMYYLFKTLKVENVDKTKQRDFINFLINKTDRTVYDFIRTAPDITSKLSTLLSDLKFIKPLFEKMKLFDIAQMIEDAINDTSRKINQSKSM